MTDEDIADTAVFAEAFHVAFDGEAFGFKYTRPARAGRKILAR